MYQCTIRVYLPQGGFSEVVYTGASPTQCLNTAKAAYGPNCQVLESRMV